MRKLLILVLVSSAVPSWGSLILYEGFNYTSGQAVVGQTNPGSGLQWFRAGVASPDTITVSSGSLTAPLPLQPTTGNSASIAGQGNASSNGSADRLAFGAGNNVTSGTVYYSLLMRVDGLTGSNNTTGGFLLGFNNSTGAQGTGPSTVGAKLQARIDAGDSSKYDLGIFNNRNAAQVSTSWSSTPLSVGDTVLIVGAYTMIAGASNDVSSLWINPGNLGDPSAPAPTVTDTTGATTDITTIASIIIRQSPAPFVTIDEIRVGTTWADVTSAVPEPATLLLLAGMVPMVAGRRRRA